MSTVRTRRGTLTYVFIWHTCGQVLSEYHVGQLDKSFVRTGRYLRSAIGGTLYAQIGGSPVRLNVTVQLKLHISSLYHSP